MAASLQEDQAARLARRLARIEHIVLSCSGKGGVGKSSCAVSLALSILAARPTARIGLLDVDLTGPSLPRMLGLDGRDVLQSADGWVPVHLYGGRGEPGLLECMSIGFLLSSSSESVVWRGPKKTAMVRQFLSDVRWGDLDWLIIDTPPGARASWSNADRQAHPTSTYRCSSRCDRCSCRRARSAARGCRRCRPSS